MEKPASTTPAMAARGSPAASKSKATNGNRPNTATPFQEHGGKADLGTRVGKDAKVARGDRAPIEPDGRRRGGRLARVDPRIEKRRGAAQGDDPEYRTPAKQIADQTSKGRADEVAADGDRQPAGNRHLPLGHRHGIGNNGETPPEKFPPLPCRKRCVPA